MHFHEKTILLKDGRHALLRSPSVEDAEALLHFLRSLSAETDFVLACPEESQRMTLEQETAFIRGKAESENCLFLICEVDGQLAGTCEVNFFTHMKTAHRSAVAIGVRSAYWNLGIGTAMFQTMIDAARARGLSLLELEFIEGNARARALYEKMGFRIVAVKPDAFRLGDGKLYNEYMMQLRL